VIHNVPMDSAEEPDAYGGVGPDECVLGVANPWVRDAYWCAVRLINVGWAIRRIGSTAARGVLRGRDAEGAGGVD
jgi:hypothetical protein